MSVSLLRERLPRTSPAASPESTGRNAGRSLNNVRVLHERYTPPQILSMAYRYYPQPAIER